LIGAGIEVWKRQLDVRGPAPSRAAAARLAAAEDDPGAGDQNACMFPRVVDGGPESFRPEVPDQDDGDGGGDDADGRPQNHTGDRRVPACGAGAPVLRFVARVS
jgi:hypothetical protein